jgi:hypothetical protein
MPRNASGTYSLPSGNPVSSGTLIDSNWANNTLNDLANEVTDSLSRSAEGGMLAPLRLTDGVQATPSLAFTNEPSTGLYRAGTNEAWFVTGGNQVAKFTSTGMEGRFAAGAAATPSLAAYNDVNTGLWFPAADTIAASTGGSERLRLDSSGNVGIGTASPTFALQVETNTNAAAGSFIRNSNTGASAAGNLSVASAVGNLILRTHSAAHSVWPNQTLIQSDSGFTNGLAILTAGANPLSFWTNSTERMRLDSSGNLGIGTASPTTKVEVYGGAAGTATNLTVGNANTGFVFGVDSTNNCQIRTAQNVSMIFYTNATNRGGVDGAGNWTLGGGTLATNATNGFLYVPTCAGTPTGTPTAITGLVPIVVDTTNNRWYFYSGGAWRNAGP